MKRIFILLALFLTACEEELSIHERAAHEPLIESFTPISAPVGAEIIVTGRFLNDVHSATIGNVPVEIIQKVSASRLSLRVGADVSTGPLHLTNAAGTGSSAESFSCIYAVPEIRIADLPSSVDMGSVMLISGQHLNAARAVHFTSEGCEPHEAVIMTRSDRELVVKVPYVEKDHARISIEYFDGSAAVSTSLDHSPTMRIVKYVPKFDAYTFERSVVGTRLVLSGQYLNNVEKAFFGDVEAAIVAEPGQLSITVPAGDFPDGNNLVELRVVYFEGRESQVLKEDFVLFVPFIKIWKDKTTVTQGRWDGSSWCAFFSPETGLVYENSTWETQLDPVAVALKGTQWGAGNVPAPGVVSDSDYNSVPPYFFFSAGSDKAVTLQSPANSTGQLKNIYKENDSKTSITGGNSWPGTPILEFILLDKESANPAEVALYNRVIEGKLEKIDEETFAIDTEAKTLGGIAVGSKIKASYGSWNKSYTGWCDKQKDYTRDLANDPVDAVFIVVYYQNYGWDSKAPLSHIKRLGVLHITKVDWGLDAGQFRRSFVTFDCYWMKYDYDYTEIGL